MKLGHKSAGNTCLFDKALKSSNAFERSCVDCLRRWAEATPNPPFTPSDSPKLGEARLPQGKAREAQKVRAQFERAWKGADVRLQASTF